MSPQPGHARRETIPLRPVVSSQKVLETDIANLLDSEMGSEPDLSYQFFVGLLHRLRLLGLHAPAREVALVQRMWQSLSTKTAAPVEKTKARRALFLVLGGKPDTAAERELKKRFSGLRQNRLSGNQTEKSVHPEAEFSFSPKVNSGSANIMARSARKKLALSLSQGESLLESSKSLPDLLIGSQIVRERKVLEESIRLDAAARNECTFSPAINRYVPRMRVAVPPSVLFRCVNRML